MPNIDHAGDTINSKFYLRGRPDQDDERCFGGAPANRNLSTTPCSIMMLLPRSRRSCAKDALCVLDRVDLHIVFDSRISWAVILNETGIGANVLWCAEVGRPDEEK